MGEGEYSKMLPQTPAEILRTEMAQVYLQLRSLGIEDVSNFPLVDPPPREALVKAVQLLRRIGALDHCNVVTEVGKKISMMPIHPLYSYILFVAVEFKCMAEALTIVSMLSTETPFFFSHKNNAAPRGSRELLCQDGDHLSLLTIFSGWKRHAQPKIFASQHGLNHTALERALAIRTQLKELVQTSWCMPITSCGGEKNYVTVRRCLLKACFTHTARLDELNQTLYTTMISHQQAKLHPSSVLFQNQPPPLCVVFDELITTSKNYIRTVTAVDPAWLTELCPQ